MFGHVKNWRASIIDAWPVWPPLKTYKFSTPPARIAICHLKKGKLEQSEWIPMLVLQKESCFWISTCSTCLNFYQQHSPILRNSKWMTTQITKSLLLTFWKFWGGHQCLLSLFTNSWEGDWPSTGSKVTRFGGQLWILSFQVTKIQTEILEGSLDVK